MTDKPFNVLHSLLVSGFDSRYKLADAYIKAFDLSSDEVTVRYDKNTCLDLYISRGCYTVARRMVKTLFYERTSEKKLNSYLQANV